MYLYKRMQVNFVTFDVMIITWAVVLASKQLG